MTREPQRVEPLLSSAFISRDYVNRKDKLADLTPPANPVFMTKRDFVAWWVLFGMLVVAIAWLAMNSELLEMVGL